MNPEIKAKWVEALRSGEYEQGTGSLRIGDHYCCLGVLCEIAVKEGVIPAPEIRYERAKYAQYTADGRDETLPYIVTQWAGLKYDTHTGGNLTVRVPGDLLPLLPNRDETFDGHAFVSALNDRGVDFARIADLIEEQG